MAQNAETIKRSAGCSSIRIEEDGYSTHQRTSAMTAAAVLLRRTNAILRSVLHGSITIR